MRHLGSLAATTSLAACSAALAAGPALPAPAFPVFADAQAIVAACDRGLVGARERVRRLAERAVDADWLKAADELNAFEEEASGPLSVIENAHPDAAIRDAAQACGLRWSEFDSELGQNEAIYRSLVAVKPADAIDRELVHRMVDRFEDAGVALARDERVRAKKLNDRIADLGQRFQQRLRDDKTRLPFTVAELAGVPAAVWQDQPRDGEGRVLLGIDNPTFLPVVDLAEQPATRERMWRARTNLGGEANLKTLAEIATLRHEYAGLFGQPSFAAFQLRRRMAGDPATTARFLGDLRAKLTVRELVDIEELRQAKARHLGTPRSTTRLDRWDVSFYSERVRRERYAVDQEAFRAYLPPEESLRFVMRVLERMFAIRYTPVPATLWHPDARAFAVSDAASGAVRAALYVDLYPRDGKFSHAAVWSFRNASTLVDRKPQAALIVNMNRKGLTLGELETLLHEMGHSVHSNLSQARYNSLAGTRVQRDFVEAPSQMLQDWVYDPQVLKLFAEVCPTCKPIPDEMIAKARVARDFAKGLQKSRQLLYASFDLALHGEEVQDPLALWMKMEGATPLGYVPGTLFPAAFQHIASGYAAGYYGYLWSEVIALDLRTPFAADRLDPAVGARYRQAVLSQGGQAPPNELVRNFLGRETDSNAFFTDLAR
jgi:thimet oligopeptidase